MLTQKGFTLIELIVAIVMLGILAAALILFIDPIKQLNKAKDAQREKDVKQVQQALDTYYNDHNCYPQEGTIQFGQPFSSGSTVYFKKLPQDPDFSSNGTSYEYITDSSACPQWNVVFSKLAQADTVTDSCPLQQIPSCLPTNFYSAGYAYCSLLGSVNCSYISTVAIPTSGGAETVPTPTGSSTPTSTPTTTPPTPTSAYPTPTLTITPTQSPTLTPTPTAVPQTDYYVATAGSDSNPGTQTLPFATINKANSVVAPGDTVHVMPGTYNQSVLTTTSGTSTQGIIYKSEGGPGAAIIVGGGTSPLFATWENTASYVTIEGFDVSGGGRFGILNYNGASNNQILQNHVHDVAVGYCTSSGGDGIGSTEAGGPHDNLYMDNLVNAVSASTKPCSYVHGFYIQGLREQVLNNIILNNAGIGVACTHACDQPTISNNTIVNNGDGIRVGWSSTTTGSTNNAIISNNIIVNNVNYAIYEYTAGMGTNNQFLNNLMYGNNPNSCNVSNCLNSVTANPLFVNNTGDVSGDYHLQTGSPAIDTGTSIGAPSTDYAGNPRPQGAGYDIGAYEQ